MTDWLDVEEVRGDCIFPKQKPNPTGYVNVSWRLACEEREGEAP